MAVGDSHQAIYGFTKNSVYLEQLTKDPNFVHYNLSKISDVIQAYINMR